MLLSLRARRAIVPLKCSKHGRGSSARLNAYLSLPALETGSGRRGCWRSRWACL